MRRRGNYQFLQKFSWYLPGVGGMFALLLWLLAGGLVGGILVTVLTAVSGQEAALAYGNLLAYPVMFVPPMLYAGIKSASNSMYSAGVRLDSRHFSPLGMPLCILLAVLGTLATGFWADGVTSLLPEMPDMLKELMKSLTQGNFLVNFLTVCIMAPVCEEWLCRGMVLRGLLNHDVKPSVAILVSAVFFALIHLNPWQAIPAFLMGLLFGYVYYRTGSLRLSMLMHFTNNCFALVCGQLDALKDMESWLDVIPLKLHIILAAACLILTALVVLSFGKVQKVRASGNLDPVPSIFDSDEV